MPVAKVSVHSVPQLMPLGIAGHACPEPVFVTVSVYCWGAGANVAVTAVFAFIVVVQAPVPLQAPLQPVNTLPAAGVAVSATAVPVERVTEQVAPQLMPLPVTVPCRCRPC